jgi:putative flippase GtrA
MRFLARVSGHPRLVRVLEHPRARRVIDHPLTWPTIRYGISGLMVATVYLGLPVVLNAAVGLSIEAGIPIAYVVAISLHFTLQRLFVFRHVESFALSKRQQAMRYVVIAAFQYPTTAIATALLPGLLGISERVAYLATAIVIVVLTYAVLRTRVFHAATDPEPDALPEIDVREVELVGGPAALPRQRDVDPIEAPVEGDRHP